MTRQELQNVVHHLNVWDTHTHLKADALPAQTFWDIGHYFWFLRELQAAGYPEEPESLPEDQRIEAFLRAFNATRNTAMNWVVRQIFKTLYDIEITDAESVKAADAAVRGTAGQADWPKQVCDRLHIKHIATNVEKDADPDSVPDFVFPRMESHLNRWIDRITRARNQQTEGETIKAEVSDTLKGFADAGHSGIMTSNDPFGRLKKSTRNAPESLTSSGHSPDDIGVFILHALCRAAEAHGLFVQFFLGVESKEGAAVPANDPDRILNLHGLFAQYACPFELVLGAELNNLDAVQAARIYPNVHVGGMWWYNFRVSTYRQSMQYRFEALPPSKCALVASDARCIEWCYGKILIIKRLMADFLYDQIEAEWIDGEDALRVAREWLYDAPAELYQKPRNGVKAFPTKT